MKSKIVNFFFGAVVPDQTLTAIIGVWKEDYNCELL